MSDLHQMTIEQELIKSDIDFQQKYPPLHAQLYQLITLNEELYKEVYDETKSQEGKIIEAIQQKTKDHTKNHIEEIKNMTDTCSNFVRSYQNQVDRLNHQRVTFYYKNEASDVIMKL